MKTLFAALVVLAACAFIGLITRGHAAETEPALEGPSSTPLKLLPPEERGKPARGALTCAYEDQPNAEVHVVLCRFEDSESCALTNPTPLREMMARYEAVKILMIGGTPEGCSKFTFTGSLKRK